MSEKLFPLFRFAYLAFGCCLLGLMACESGGPAEGNWLLKGQVENYRGRVVLDRVTPARVFPLDSATIGEDGSFSFERKLGESTFYEVRFTANGAHFPFYPDVSTLDFAWDPQVKGSWSFTGSQGSEILHDFIMQRGAFFKMYTQEKKNLQLIPKSTLLEKWRNQEAAVDRALITYRGYLRNFIDTVSIPDMQLYAMYSMNMDGNFHYLQEELGQMEGGDGAFKTALQNELDRLSIRFADTEPVDIVGKDPQEEEVNMKAEKGHMTVLYFWASYCEYSRQETELLSKLYSQYHDRGFSVFSVSIDDFKSSWEAASENIPWRGNIWQSGAWEAEALAGYDVPTIPTTYLLDAKGALRSKNIRASDLQAHMEELLNVHGPKDLQ